MMIYWARAESTISPLISAKMSTHQFTTVPVRSSRHRHHSHSIKENWQDWMIINRDAHAALPEEELLNWQPSAHRISHPAQPPAQWPLRSALEALRGCPLIPSPYSVVMVPSTKTSSLGKRQHFSTGSTSIRNSPVDESNKDQQPKKRDRISESLAAPTRTLFNQFFANHLMIKPSVDLPVTYREPHWCGESSLGNVVTLSVFPTFYLVLLIFRDLSGDSYSEKDLEEPRICSMGPWISVLSMLLVQQGLGRLLA
ncbi:hypothetical protein EDD18DRAFT_1329799 [Armillaria luteobubalina]|uniref:Uncharacterized protein n=1 Tax=Armillaria luteobubalina TaxID=153913 RepID=A0AA39URF2_9AGAR|nr:hypothetical protein EDD18DRAFT_1329799 [Armillaria luteobubalina]